MAANVMSTSNPQGPAQGRYVRGNFAPLRQEADFELKVRGKIPDRYVRTPRWLAEHAAGRALFGGLGRPNDPAVEGIASGGANTHVIFHAGKLLALQESSNPFEMDPATLASIGWVETGGRFTAHPKIDPKTGEMFWFAYSSGSEPLNPFLDYGVTSADGRVVRRDRFRAPFCSMVHDFMMTEHYVVFPVLPVTGDMERAKRGPVRCAGRWTSPPLAPG
jgi:carotenoid cleavage dioxygenase-like enzyme